MFLASGAGLIGCGSAGQGATVVTVKGSDTMVHLAMELAEAYMNAHPDTEVSVTGGGSGTGIAALLNGSTDICTASRDLQDKEQETAQSKGMSIDEHGIALDGIAIIVNPENPVNELSLDDLKKMYTGSYTRWSDVGGPDQPILLLSRESSSGTYVFFQEHVLEKQDYSKEARLMPATSAIVESVASDAWSIGYIGLGYAEGAGDRVKVIGIKMDAGKSIMPTVDSVISGEYPISRPLHLYTTSEATAAARAFIEFTLSPAGQAIVKGAGYVPVK
ncbi:MAG: PstS family phosphate ABC transporter substrate-binding protein [Candidatus Hydrogenedentes bacterium]|nr:PstS family phosphate ABC transporter substrate-binding protein [Candidatus Hydrogenedentota bacterium]